LHQTLVIFAIYASTSSELVVGVVA